MKILVLSLLRLGDAIMHLKLIDEIRVANPGATVDLVVNSQFAHIDGIAHSADSVISFPRNMLQSILTNENTSLFQAYSELEGWVEIVNKAQYDLVYDLTNTQFSHQLRLLIKAKSTKNTLKNNYLNTVFSISKRTTFHYIDAIRYQYPELKSNQIATVEERQNKKISIQPLTSDPKKNWGLKNYVLLIEKIKETYPEHRISILGSLAEEQILRKSFAESQNVKIEVLDLQELEFQLWDADLLVSGDTAVVHLAANSKTPTLALYTGSADPFKSAPYVQGSMILHAEEVCSPCGHSEKCNQPSFICSESIVVDDVWEIISHYISNQNWLLKQFSFHMYLTKANYKNQLLLSDFNDEFAAFKNASRQFYWGDIDLKNLMKTPSKFYFEIKTAIDNINHGRKIVLELEAELSKNENCNNYLSDFSKHIDDGDLVSLLQNLLISQKSGKLMEVETDMAMLVDKLNSKSNLYQIYLMQLRERGFVDVTGSRELS